MYKINLYVPESHLALVKQALFEAGAGRFDNYQEVCWQVLGEGQFRPLENAKPAEGEVGKLEILPEYRLEMVCDEHLIGDAIAALKMAHPYEEPAYEVVRLLDY